jgi:ketosteroid isomerase-like protein
MTAEQALAFARKHVDTWNTHDLDAIMALYSQSVELVSPLAGAITGATTVRGQARVRDYFERGLQKYPELHFELVDTFLCRSSVTLLFHGAGRKLVAEVLFIDSESKIERVFAHYRAEHSGA